MTADTGTTVVCAYIDDAADAGKGELVVVLDVPEVSSIFGPRLYRTLAKMGGGWRLVGIVRWDASLTETRWRMV